MTRNELKKRVKTWDEHRSLTEEGVSTTQLVELKSNWQFSDGVQCRSFNSTKEAKRAVQSATYIGGVK
jgi:hypothetical protein